MNSPTGPLLSSLDIANYFNKTWSIFSSDPNFSQEYISEKRSFGETKYVVPTNQTL